MVFLFAAIVLIAAAGAAYYAEYFGGTWGSVLPFALLSATLLSFGGLSSSSSVRAKLRRFVTLHRYSLHYSGLVVVGLMWTLPFLIPSYRLFFRTQLAEALAVALGLLALVVLPVFVRTIELPRVSLLPFAFIGLILIQLLFGLIVYPQEGVLAGLYLLWSGGLVILAVLLRRELGLERVTATLAWFALAGALTNSLIGLTQHIGVDVLPAYLILPRSPNRVWANLGQPNHLADYLTLGSVSAGYLYATGRLRAYWMAPILLALVYVLGLTGSRAVWLYLAGAITLSFVFWRLDQSISNRRLLEFSVVALAAYMLLPILLQLFLPGHGLLTSSSTPRLVPDALAVDPRLPIWEAALLVFLQYPVLGVGLGGFGWHYLLVNTQMHSPRVEGFVLMAHSLPLQVLSEFGLVGFSILAGFTSLWIAGLVRQPRTPAQWWLWAMAWVLGVHSMLEYPLWYGYFAGVAAIILGVGDPHTINLRLERWGRSARIVLLTLLGLGSFILSQLYRDAQLLRDLDFGYRSTPNGSETNRTIQTRFSSSLLLPNVERALAATISITPDQLETKLALNTRVMRRYPTSDVVYRQAVLLALHDEKEAARRQWDLAVISFPEKSLEALWLLNRLVLEHGQHALQGLIDYAREKKQ